MLLLSSPVLYEGRYRPLETIPEGAHYSSIDTEDYHSLAGTVYLQAEGKQLRYPTQGQLQAERILYRLPLKWILISCYLLSFSFVFYKQWLGWGCLAFGFIFHTFVLAMRSYILLRPPVSNMSETILYVPWIAALIGLCFIRKKMVLSASALVAAGLLLFLPAQPSLDPVQAVLDSQYWLIIHVLMVVGSYGIFFVAGIYAHILLFKPSQAHEKTLMQILYIGTALLIGGTILGGVWAAQSWGRFWDWDPKEAWAFISSGIYLIFIHAYRFKKIGVQGLATGAILGLLSITFTWYGVNFILGTGLHSYGFGNGGELFYYLYLIAEIMFLTAAYTKNKFYKKRDD